MRTHDLIESVAREAGPNFRGDWSTVIRAAADRTGDPKIIADVILRMDTLAAALGRGQTSEAAAQSTGLGSSTVFRWLALGRAGDPRFAALAELAGEAAKVRKARKPKKGRKGRRTEFGGAFDLASFRGMF